MTGSKVSFSFLIRPIFTVLKVVNLCHDQKEQNNNILCQLHEVTVKIFVKLTKIYYLKPIHVSIVMKDNEIRIKTCFILLNSSVELIHIQRQHINEKGILNQENQKLKNFSFG